MAAGSSEAEWKAKSRKRRKGNASRCDQDQSPRYLHSPLGRISHLVKKMVVPCGHRIDRETSADSEIPTKKKIGRNDVTLERPIERTPSVQRKQVARNWLFLRPIEVKNLNIRVATNGVNLNDGNAPRRPLPTGHVTRASHLWPGRGSSCMCIFTFTSRIIELTSYKHESHIVLCNMDILHT